MMMPCCLSGPVKTLSVEELLDFFCMKSSPSPRPCVLSGAARGMHEEPHRDLNEMCDEDECGNLTMDRITFTGSNYLG